MMLGKLLSTTGACPICGQAVTLRHVWNGQTLTDRYACASCGETSYSVTRAEDEVLAATGPVPLAAS